MKASRAEGGLGAITLTLKCSEAEELAFQRVFSYALFISQNNFDTESDPILEPDELSAAVTAYKEWWPKAFIEDFGEVNDVMADGVMSSDDRVRLLGIRVRSKMAYPPTEKEQEFCERMYKEFPDEYPKDEEVVERVKELQKQGMITRIP